MHWRLDYFPIFTLLVFSKYAWTKMHIYSKFNENSMLQWKTIFLVLDAPSRVWTLTVTSFECFYCRLTNTLTLSTTDQWLHPQIRTTAIGTNNWLYEMTSYQALLRKEYKFMDLIDCIVKYWCTVLINYVRNNAILFESTKSCLTYNQK